MGDSILWARMLVHTVEPTSALQSDGGWLDSEILLPPTEKVGGADLHHRAQTLDLFIRGQPSRRSMADTQRCGGKRPQNLYVATGTVVLCWHATGRMRSRRAGRGEEVLG